MNNKELKRLLETAAEELHCMIELNNENMREKITSQDLDEPDYFDFETCYKLMVAAKDLS
jgi:hypothetical protein